MSRRRHEEGFTLVELMVAVTILAILTATLASAFIVTFRTADDANERLALAHDVQISTAAFASDVQSADQVWTGDPAPTCGPGGGLLNLRWVDGTTVNLVTYAVTTAGSERRLVRHRCTVGASSTQQVLSHFVSSVAAPSCDAGPCGTAAVPARPRQVVLTVTDTLSAQHELRGTRRSTA